MSITQLITELGGFGAISSGVFRLFAMGRQTELEDRDFKVKCIEAEKQWVGVSREFFSATAKQTGPMVHRMLAIACFIVIIAPISIPIFTNYVTVHYFVPKGVSFLTLNIDMWKDLVVGPDPKTLPEGEVMKHIAIYPMQISLCANYLSFYLVGRALKHK